MLVLLGQKSLEAVVGVSLGDVCTRGAAQRYLAVILLASGMKGEVRLHMVQRLSFTP